jgi:predicted RNA binding protein YcfA (HicA-like mRNA interferase family)
MDRWPRDIPKRRVLKTLQSLGFNIVREKKHISLIRKNPDGTETPLTIPNHLKIKGSTLRVICNQAGIAQEEFLKVLGKK